MLVLFYVSLSIFFGLCGLLSFIILIQESKSLGLGASFGGDAGSSVFGTSTADILKKVTAWMAAIFLILSLMLSYWSGAISKSQIRMPTVIESGEQ